MRGLEQLRQQGVDVDVARVVPLFDHRDPIRTEAEAWANILRQRREAGIPISMEEYQEAWLAFADLRTPAG